MNTGVYIIQNTESDRVYIGSTVNLKRRWRTHRNRLRRGAHGNPHLQRAWDYYSEGAFEFGALEYLDNPEELHLAEQFWMDVYREEGRELYNCGLVAHNPMLGRKHTRESRQKMATAHKKIGHTEETRRKISRTMTGRTLSEKHRRNLCCPRPTLRGRSLSKEHRRNIGRSYPAFIHRETGEVIPAGVNLSEMCRERGLTRQLMDMVKHGKNYSHRGWILAREAK